MAYTYGLAGIYIAPLAGDGGPGTVFTLLGKTNPGTTKISTDKGTKTEKFCEETSDPLVSIPGNRTKTIEFQLIVEGVATLEAVLGGSSAAGVWSEPDAVPVIEKTLKMVPQAGGTLIFNRVSFDCALNATLSKEGDLFYVDCVATVLQPTKAGVKKMTFTE